MRERIFEGEFIIDIDNNGDNYESFEKSVNFIRDNYIVVEKKFYSGFFDDALFHFEYKGLLIKIIFSGFMGTEAHILENEPSENKDQFRKLAKSIIEFISSHPA